MIIHSMTRCSGAADLSRFQWTEEDISLSDAESLLEQDSGKAGRHSHAVRDFLALTFRDYCSRHQVSAEKRKVVNSMIACKTGKLGYTMICCEKCGRTELRPCACGNRNCPSCGYLNEKRWVALRQSEVIPGIPYYHLVFTLPHKLNPLMYQNQKETLDLLFHSVHASILELSRDKLKMIPGILTVLHTFGSNLSLHYHLHVLVTGGGLTLDKKSFKKCLSERFFLPLKAVAKVYRGKFMSGLKTLRRENRLKYCHDSETYRNSYSWKELLDSCYETDWNVEIRYLAPSDPAGNKIPDTETTDNAVNYFARYTNRTAVSDSRIQSFDSKGIDFRYKDYSNGSYTMKMMHLTSEEFIRRFLMHILPAHFSRIRWAGFLAGCVRGKNLKLIHSVLDMEYRESPVRKMTSAELLKYFYHRDVTVCPRCHSSVKLLQRVDKRAAANYIRAS